MVKRGWFNESFRHTMSAYGIKTAKARNTGRSTARPRSKKMKFDWKVRNYRAEKIAGGLAEGLPAYKFDPDELYRGMMVEMEHTDDPDVAEELAKDHLIDDPNYYGMLEKMRGGVGMFGVTNVATAPAFEAHAPEDEQYFAFKEGGGLLDTTEVKGLDTEMRERTVQEATVVAENRLKEEEDERKMQSEWTERYMRDEFPGFANRYLSDQVYTRQQFLDEVKRDVDRYAGRNSGELKVFNWGE